MFKSFITMNLDSKLKIANNTLYYKLYIELLLNRKINHFLALMNVQKIILTQILKKIITNSTSMMEKYGVNM